MTIQTEISKAVYVANGSSVSFVIPFYFLENQIAVYKGKTQTPLISGTDYTVTGSGEQSGGEVTFSTAPASGTVITIVRNVELTQLIKFMEGESFPASDYEYSLDKMIMALQQFKERLNACVQIPYGLSLTSKEVMDIIVLVNENLSNISNLPTFIQNLSTLQTNLSTNYYNKTSIDSQLSNYYDKTSIDSQFANYSSSSVIAAELANYYTKTEVDSQLSSYYTKTGVDSLLTSYYTKTGVDGLLANYYTKSEVNTAVGNVAPIKYTSVSVNVADIVSDNTYAAYPYRADVTLSGATSSHIPEVCFNVEEAVTGNFAPVADTYTNGIKIYMKEVPSANFTIASVVLH